MNLTSKRLLCTSLLLFSLLGAGNTVFSETIKVDSSQISVSTSQEQGMNVLSTKLDNLGRPIESHFIGNDANQVGKRVGSPSEPSNLKKWSNQKVNTKVGDFKATYLWDRGHLVGNQFAGLVSNEADNIVGETSYTNQKLMTYFEGGTKAANPNALDNWLYLHPNYYIDYTIQANYKGTEQYPRTITLTYRGLDQTGNPIRIQLPNSNLEGIQPQKELENEFTQVEIYNILPGWSINYLTGRATKNNNWKTEFETELANITYNIPEVLTVSDTNTDVVNSLSETTRNTTEDISNTVNQVGDNISKKTKPAQGFFEMIWSLLVQLFSAGTKK